MSDQATAILNPHCVAPQAHYQRPDRCVTGSTIAGSCFSDDISKEFFGSPKIPGRENQNDQGQDRRK